MHPPVRCAMLRTLCCAAVQDGFRRSLPGIEAWQARVVSECRRLGYVEVGAVLEVAAVVVVGAACFSGREMRRCVALCWGHGRRPLLAC